jgi:hypothetical protein
MLSVVKRKTTKEERIKKLKKLLPDVKPTVIAKALKVVCDLLDAEDGADVDDPTVQRDILDQCERWLARDGVVIRSEDFFEVARLAFAEEDDVDISGLKKGGKAKARAKKQEREAIRARLDLYQALEPFVAMRPEVRHGSFTPEAAKAIVDAWPRFDRRVFAERVFEKLIVIDLSGAGPLRDISGIEGVTGVSYFYATLDPECDLSPLAGILLEPPLRGPSLSGVKIPGKPHGFGPLARLPRLSVVEAGELDDQGLRELSAIKSISNLTITVGKTVDLAPLKKLTKLSCLSLRSEGRTLDSSTEDVMRALCERCEYISLRAKDGWPTKLTIPKSGDDYIELKTRSSSGKTG